MASTLRPLGALFAEWPTDVADTLSELASYDLSTLREVLAEKGVDDETSQVIFDLRSHSLDIKNAADREAPLSGPEAVSDALGVTLCPPPGRWITYPLDASRRRLAAPHKSSGSRFLCTITAKVPSPDELHPLPEGGTYLLVRQDSPEVLNIPGVIERIDHLAQSVNLADVVLYERASSPTESSTVYSLRRGVGAKGRTPVVLDLENRVEQKARLLWQ
jgi:hypothetical protein